MMNQLRDANKNEIDNTYLPDMTPRREGGDDSLAESSPHDPRSDEKVIANEQYEQKIDKTETGTAPASRDAENRDADLR